MQVHEGLQLPPGGMFSVGFSGASMLRPLLHDFAEAAILSYLSTPRSSLIGHPDLYPAAD